MQASIVLDVDQPGNVSFTNLDEISGKVIVRSAKSADVANITVKLEGESRTRLLSPSGPNDERPKPQLEYHKILYKTQVVFPPPDVFKGRANTSGKGGYTLPPGNHEYPWKFKIPFNNACHAQRSTISNVGISNFGIELPKTPTAHVHKTLPPTLRGFPGEADIRYFVKVTVARQSFFKENSRSTVPFNFFPIEPPRPPDTGSQVYARQKHGFTAYPVDFSTAKKDKMKNIFSKKASSPTIASFPGDAPFISVDARLPEPAILTCNQSVPLSIIVKRLNSASREAIYLQSLQVSLIAATKIRAHDVFRTEQNSWIIMSNSNMSIRIGTDEDVEGTETVLDNSLWRSQTLPNTVAPSFETCNISRTYTLDVRVGLSYGGSSKGKVRKNQIQQAVRVLRIGMNEYKLMPSSQPQSVILPLRLDTQIYSGIAPPAEILERMAAARANRPTASPSKPVNTAAAMDEKLRTEGRKPSMTAGPSSLSSDLAAPPIPARPGQMPVQEPPDYSEAPPSYEDAIAGELAPLDAPRPDYAPPPVAEDDLLSKDEKKIWVH